MSLSAEDVRAYLREECDYEGSQKAFARLVGVSPQFLCDVLRGRREPSGELLEWLGLERVVTYREPLAKRKGNG